MAKSEVFRFFIKENMRNRNIVICCLTLIILTSQYFDFWVWNCKKDDYTNDEIFFFWRTALLQIFLLQRTTLAALEAKALSFYIAVTWSSFQAGYLMCSNSACNIASFWFFSS